MFAAENALRYFGYVAGLFDSPGVRATDSPSTGGARLLIATGTVVADVNQIPPLVRSLLETAAEILVITPILPGRLQWWVSDTDRARHQADERLDAVLGQMKEMDLPAAGRVADETPLTAFDDAVRSFRPDHILIALRGGEDAGWQERGLLDQLRGRYALPITIFEIGSGGEVSAQ